MEVVLGKAEAAGEGSSSESESGGRRGAVAPAPTAPRMTPEDVRCVLLGLLHAADLGNCVKPIHIHASWSVQVIQEVRGERERDCHVRRSNAHGIQSLIEPMSFRQPIQMLMAFTG